MSKCLKLAAMCAFLLLVPIILAQPADAFTITMTNETPCDVAVSVFVVNGTETKDGVITRYLVGPGTHFTINKGGNLVKDASATNPRAQISRLDGIVMCKEPEKRPASLGIRMCANGVAENTTSCDTVVDKDISVTIKKDPDGKFHFKRLN